MNQRKNRPLIDKEFLAQMKSLAVKARSVVDFLESYRIPSRWSIDRDQQYRDMIIEDSEEEIKKYGYTIIVPHNSVTGGLVTYFPKIRMGR